MAKKQPKADELCLKCKAPKGSKPGSMYRGKGSNGMIALLWMCDECSAQFAARPTVVRP